MYLDNRLFVVVSDMFRVVRFFSLVLLLTCFLVLCFFSPSFSSSFFSLSLSLSFSSVLPQQHLLGIRERLLHQPLMGNVEP